MVSEKPDEQNPENPDDHDATFLFDEHFIYGQKPNYATCTLCGATLPLGEQRSVSEQRAKDHRNGLDGGPGCTPQKPNPAAGR